MHPLRPYGKFNLHSAHLYPNGGARKHIVAVSNGRVSMQVIIKVHLRDHSKGSMSKVNRTDTANVSMSKKKAPATTNRSKGIDLLSEATLLDYAQMKKVLKRSKTKIHSHQASGSGDRFGSQPKVPDELQDKATGTNEGTGTIPDRNDDDSDNDRNDDDSDDDGNNDASDDEGTESDDDQKDDDKEEEYEDEYVRTPVNYGSTNDENEHGNEEEYDRIDEELYKDVNVKLKDVEQGEEGKGDAKKIDAGHDSVTQETTYDQVEDDAHVTLTTVHDT
ncbi:hypothetical protein Tco_0647394 [Tanacetum coccineum]